MTISDLTPIITASSAIIGVIAGSVISYFSNSRLKDKEYFNKAKTDKIAEKKSVYIEFLSHINRASSMSLHNKSKWTEHLDILSTDLAKIEILSNKNICDAAIKLFNKVLDFYADNPQNNDISMSSLHSEFITLVKSEIEDTKGQRSSLNI